MTISRETLVNEALTLPPVERVAVIDRLLSSLDEADQKLDALWADEAELSGPMVKTNLSRI